MNDIPDDDDELSEEEAAKLDALEAEIDDGIRKLKEELCGLGSLGRTGDGSDADLPATMEQAQAIVALQYAIARSLSKCVSEIASDTCESLPRSIGFGVVVMALTHALSGAYLSLERGLDDSQLLLPIKRTDSKKFMKDRKYRIKWFLDFCRTQTKAAIYDRADFGEPNSIKNLG